MPPVEKFEFTRNWNSPSDFPTYEPDEVKVRADMQALPDELKTYLNEKMAPAVDEKVPGSRTVNGHPLTEDVEVTKEDVGLGNVDNTSDEDKPISKAQQIALDAKANKTDVLQKDNTTPYTPTQPYHPSTKDYTDRAVAGAVMGQVPDGSITDKKLANDSVTEEKLSPGIRKSVTEDFPNHIADKNNPHGVTAEQVPYDNSRTELASDTAQGAIDELFARMYGDMKVQVQVYETGTTTPIPGVLVTGVASESGGPCYADEDGVATGYVLSDAQTATATIKVDERYIDLTGQTEQTVSVRKGETSNATLYATRVSNPSGKIETFTASTQKMFTDKVNRVDVHCVGGGGGGNSGRAVNLSGRLRAYGGAGGAQGKSAYNNSISFTPNEPFSVTVGAKGIGGSRTSSSTSGIETKVGGTGGTSSCLGISASGGVGGAGGSGARCIIYETGNDGGKGAANVTQMFGDSSAQFGGSGGGGGAYVFFSGSETEGAQGNGGSPHGGNGAAPSSSAYKDGADAGGIGAGGGGGNASAVNTGTSGSTTTYRAGAGGDGGPGAVYVRWFYA